MEEFQKIAKSEDREIVSEDREIVSEDRKIVPEDPKIVSEEYQIVAEEKLQKNGELRNWTLFVLFNKPQRSHPAHHYN